MNLRQIEVFHAVMIKGSTVGAAEMLHVTQPAISTTLKRMQDELGLALFVTASGRLTPTPEARALFAQARALQQDVESMRRLARMLALGKVGSLRLGIVPAISEGALAAIVERLSGEAPDLTMTVDVLNSHDLVNMLLGGRLDIACVFGNDHGEPLETYATIVVPLAVVGPIGVLPEGRVTLAHLAGLSTAGLRRTDPIGRVLAASCAAQDVRLEPSIELRSSRAVVALASRGVASGVVDTLTLVDFEPSRFDRRALDPELSIDMRVVRLSGGPLAQSEARAINAIVQVISDRLSGLPKADNQGEYRA
jgi:DNA-binding transcriptional LysR family regulator